jgi:protein-S-isoprenylcysteine O-methyltransferase Ste14
MVNGFKAAPGRGAQRRNPENQKIGQLFGPIAFVATFLVSALDHRFGWSSPTPIVISREIVMVGLVIFLSSYGENTFTSAMIDLAAAQRVVSSGLYSTVRHPTYVATLIMISNPAGAWLVVGTARDASTTDVGDRAKSAQ